MHYGPKHICSHTHTHTHSLSLLDFILISSSGTVRLPYDGEDGDPMIATASVQGKRRDAVAAAALEVRQLP